MVNTCILYGATNWIGISLLVLLISVLVIAVVYQFSGLFPDRTRAKLKSAARSELTQMFISALIIGILAGAATTACTLSSTISTNLTGKSMSPFAYAEYYIGGLSTNTGLSLLTNLYSISVSYAVEAQIMTNVGSLMNTFFSKVIGLILSATASKYYGSLTVIDFTSLGALFQTLSVLYLDVFAPIITIAVGLLFVQFLLLPVFQYTAFSIILPVAITMRSLSFLGHNLRSAANMTLAIAIGAYIVYPLMISFNAYAISWIFSSSNPSYQYLQSTYVIPNIPTTQYFNMLSPSSVLGSTSTTLFDSVWSVLFTSTNILTNPLMLVSQAQMLVNQMAQFIFASIVMIVIDLAVTLGFVVGLAKALNSGIEGAGSFWGRL